MSAHIIVVEGRYYEEVSDALAAGALCVLEARGATHERIVVPGALEIPQAAALALDSGRFDGVIALGCVIRGETSHYDIVAGESARALMDIALTRATPVGNGILTVDTRAQAMARAAVDGRDKGGDAATACLDVLDIRRKFTGRTNG